MQPVILYKNRYSDIPCYLDFNKKMEYIIIKNEKPLFLYEQKKLQIIDEFHLTLFKEFKHIFNTKQGTNQ